MNKSTMIMLKKSLVIFVLLNLTFFVEAGMFRNASNILPPLPVQMNYGVAVTNVDGVGTMEWVVAGFKGPNIVLQYNTETGVYRNIAREGTAFENLMDPEGEAIGVCACDVDGDGREEIYFLNTNQRYSGPKDVPDRLYKWVDGRYVDLFKRDENKRVPPMFSGRSVACIDRLGTGRYGFLIATYARDSKGKFGLIEMDEGRSDVASGRIVLKDVAEDVGLDFSTGGRGIAVGPILGDDGFSDVYFVNEGGHTNNRGDNALFRNDGRGHFTNVARELGLSDYEPGRGVALTDFNNDQLVDIVYGNWMGTHKIQIQRQTEKDQSYFQEVRGVNFSVASPIRTVIPADFDNDGVLEIFMNNIVYRSQYVDSSNKLYKVLPRGETVQIQDVPIGDAEEPDGYGTGAAVADIDNDGILELLISHGESSAQSISHYHVSQALCSSNYLRVLPLTVHGAPARGSKITVMLYNKTKLSRVIDGGSGYLCEMEPVAHFGLGENHAVTYQVLWPDGSRKNFDLNRSNNNKLHVVSFSGSVDVLEPSQTSFCGSRESAVKVEIGGNSGNEVKQRQHRFRSITPQQQDNRFRGSYRWRGPRNRNSPGDVQPQSKTRFNYNRSHQFYKNHAFRNRNVRQGYKDKTRTRIRSNRNQYRSSNKENNLKQRNIYDTLRYGLRHDNRNYPSQTNTINAQSKYSPSRNDKRSQIHRTYRSRPYSRSNRFSKQNSRYSSSRPTSYKNRPNISYETSWKNAAMQGPNYQSMGDRYRNYTRISDRRNQRREALKQRNGHRNSWYYRNHINSKPSLARNVRPRTTKHRPTTFQSHRKLIYDTPSTKISQYNGQKGRQRVASKRQVVGLKAQRVSKRPQPLRPRYSSYDYYRTMKSQPRFDSYDTSAFHKQRL